MFLIPFLVEHPGGIMDRIMEHLDPEAKMKRREKTKYVHEGKYVAEVEVVLMEDESGWAPYLSLEDAYKLDDVRDALRRGDLKLASKYGRIYELRPVAHM
jgi:hypothetical protein